MLKALKKQVEAAIQSHVHHAARMAMSGNRDALRAIGLGECYTQELREVLKPRDYDPAAMWEDMLGD